MPILPLSSSPSRATTSVVVLVVKPGDDAIRMVVTVVLPGLGILLPVAPMLARTPRGSVGGCGRGWSLSFMAVRAGMVARLR